MKKKRLSVEQIVAGLKQAELGVPTTEVIRKVGISEQPFNDICLHSEGYTCAHPLRSRRMGRIELLVVRQVISDDPIAHARPLLKSLAIKNADHAPLIVDQPFFL